MDRSGGVRVSVPWNCDSSSCRKLSMWEANSSLVYPKISKGIQFDLQLQDMDSSFEILRLSLEKEWERLE